MLLRLFGYVAFKIVFFLLCWLFNWLGVKIRELFTAEEETLHIGGLLGVRSTVKNLEAHPDGWNNLLKLANIPLRVKCGGIEYIELEFGWLLFGRLSLKICGLHLLLSTTNERYYNKNWHIQKKIQLKRLLVKKFEQLEGKVSSGGEDVSWFTKLLIGIIISLIRKIEISLEDIHIRGEDELSLINETTSAGFALRRLILREDNLLRKRQSNGLGSAKTLDIQSMCLYWNPNELTPFSKMSQSSAKEKMRLNPSTPLLGCCYILKPSCIGATVVLSKGKVAVMQWKLHIDVQGIDFELSKEQLRASVQCMGHLKHLQNTYLFLEHRPKVPILGGHGHAREWWLYAKKCICIYFRRSKWDWLDLKGQGELRKSYVINYKELLRKGPSRSLKRKLQRLEDEMSLLNILLVRKKVEEEVESSLVTTATNIRQSRFSWLRPHKKWRNKPNWKEDNRQMVFYSVSGRCSATNVRLTLTDLDKDTEKKVEVFSAQVCKSFLSIIKEDQSVDFEVTLGHVRCIGTVNSLEEERTDLLQWAEPDDTQPVLSAIVMSRGNNLMSTTSQHFHHKINCTLKPSVLIIDWSTVHCISQYIALITNTHKDLKDAVKERVKEVGRESQLKLRHFIANKELASITADLQLPLVVLKDTLGKGHHMALHCGVLSIKTTESTIDNKKGLGGGGGGKNKRSNDGISLFFDGRLEGIKLIFQEKSPPTLNNWQEWFLSSSKNTPLKNDTIISNLTSLHSSITYSTFQNVSIPSKLSVNVNTSQLSVSITDEQLEDVLEFSYGQLSSLWTAVGVATNNTLFTSDAFDEVDGPGSFTLLDETDLSNINIEPLVSTIYRDLKRFSSPPLLARSVTELGLEGITDKGTEEEDFTVFTFDGNIDKIEVHIKRRKDRWIKGFILLEVDKVGVVSELREQASRLLVSVCQISLINTSRLGKDGHPIKLIETTKDFLHLKYTFANPKTPLFLPAYEAIEEEYIISVCPFTLCLHREAVHDILSAVINLSIPPFKSLMGRRDTFDNNTNNNNYTLLPSEAPPTAPPTGGAIRLLHRFSLKEFTVTMATEKASTIVKATVTDIGLSYINKYDSGEFNAKIQRVSVLDCLIISSPYSLVLSNLPDKQLINIEVCWGADSGQVNLMTGQVSIGSLQTVYLHKLKTTIQLFLREVYYYWNEAIKEVDIKLTAAVRAMKRSKSFPRQPRKPKPNSLIWSYQIDVHMESPSLLLPKNSFDLDAIRVSIREIKLTCVNRLKTRPGTNNNYYSDDDGIIEEPDSYGLFDTTSNDRRTIRTNNVGPVSETKVNATIEMINVDWIFGGQEDKTVSKAIKMTLDHTHTNQLYSSQFTDTPSPWKLNIPDLEMVLTPEALATVPMLLKSNFTEKEPLGLPWQLPRVTMATNTAMPLFDSQSSSSSVSSEESDKDETTPTPLIELTISNWVWLLYMHTEQGQVVMATVTFEKCTTCFGVSRRNEVWLQGCIKDITGVEETYKNHYHDNWRILRRSTIGKQNRSLQSRNTPLLSLSVKREKNEDLTVSCILCNLCLSLWPNFINTFIKFLKQCKVHETKTAKRWRKHTRSLSITVAPTVVPPIRKMKRHPSHSGNVTRPYSMALPSPPESGLMPILENENVASTPSPPMGRLNFKCILDECIIAILEDPEPQEVTTPGVYIEFHSYKADLSHAAVLDYISSHHQWGITLSPCQLRAYLCLYGETIIPLNQVIPPTSLEFNYVSSDSLQRTILIVPRLSIHLSDELRQVFEHFINKIRTQSESKPVATTTKTSSAAVITGIWVVKNVDRDTVLPEPLPSEETDVQDDEEYDDDDVFNDDDDDKKEVTAERHQEATIEIKECLVNFDINCGGDSSTVLCVHSAAFADLKQWDSDDVSLDLQVTMEVFVYNNNVAAWEPLIEPLEDAVIGEYRPYKLKAKVYRVYDVVNETSIPLSPTLSSSSNSTRGDRSSRNTFSSGSPKSISQRSLRSNNSKKQLQTSPPKPAYVVICTSDDHLEVTLTPSAITTIKQLIEAQTKDHHVAMSNIRSAVQDSRPPVRVDNKTGVEMYIYPGPTFKDGTSFKEKYKASVLLPTHSMKHFDSVIEPTEAIDFMDRFNNSSHLKGTFLPPLFEDIMMMNSDGGLEVEGGGGGGRGRGGGRDSVDGLPLYLNRHTTSLDAIDEDEDSDTTDSIMSNSNSYDSLSSSKWSDTISSLAEDIPVIEGSMNDIISGSGSRRGNFDETDSGYIDSRAAAAGSGRSRRRSVSRLRSVTTSGNHDHVNRLSTRGSYWKPKSLFQAHKIKLQLNESNKSKAVKVSHPNVSVIPLNHVEYGWISVVCEVSIKNKVRKVIVHSGLQIKNELPMNVTIYARERPHSVAEKIGEIERDQNYFVPLKVVAKRLYLSFGVGSNGISCEESVKWQDMRQGKPVILTCPESTHDNFYIRAVLESLPALNVTSYSPSHMIRLEPSLILHNHLPITISVILQATPTRHTHPSESFTLDPSEDELIIQYHLKGDVVIRVKFDYSGLSWQGHSTVRMGPSIVSSIPVEGFDENGKSVGKMFVCLQSDGIQNSHLNFFSPFWIVNKTGLELEYEHQSGKGKVYKHVGGAEEGLPVLLTYNKTSKSEEHQKVKLKVNNGEWSKPFVVGVVGKSFSVSSKQNNFLYEFSIETHLLKNVLTEIVYVIPKYSVLNETKVPLVCIPLGVEGDGKTRTAIRILPKELLPFWPGTMDRICVSVGELGTRGRQFSLSVASPMVLPMNDDKLPVLTVKLQYDPVKSATVISLHSYADTSALLQIVNLCRELGVKFVQGMTSGSGQMRALSCNQQVLYTWDSPSAKKELKWQIIGAQEANWHTMIFEQVKQTGSVTLHIVKDEKLHLVTCYWATMFEGSQLSLVFLDNEKDFSRLMELRQRKETADLQFFCSLEGIGLSLVNNVPKEVAYCTISSSPTIWMKKSANDGEPWSPIDKGNSALLETTWRTGERSLTISDEEYDVDNMVINGGKNGYISRWFNPGIWVWYSHCLKRSSLNVRLGRVQIDNQLDEIEFPKRLVFSAKDTQASDEVAAPFLDFLLTFNTQDLCAIREIEKCFLKIKPTQVNIELGLVASILHFTEVLETKDIEIVEFSKEDMILINKPLQELLKTDTLVKERTVNYIDVLQIAQTSVSVSYTTAGDYDLSSQWGKVVNALIHFALITKGTFDINLKSVTISNEVLDAEQMKRLIWGHYKNEMLFQFQKFALGLDVIGNPVKLLNSFQIGTKELVNYSRQGIIDGEAGSGIAVGVKSFLGHFIEGSAESGARSTGTLSSMLLAATDIDYQRKHRYMRQATNDRNLTSNLKLGSTFFIKGLLHGTTDIIVKPITGASSEGFEGFMKGIGRGTVSVLIKPTLGAVDLAKYTMEGIRSAVDDEVYIDNARLPRLIHTNKVITPYNSHEAEGLYIIRHLSEPLLDENYVFHEWLPPTKPTADPLVIFVTSKQLLQLRKSRRHYRREWSTGLETISRIEAMHFVIEGQKEENPGLLLIYQDDGYFRKKQNEFVVKLGDTMGAQVLEEKIIKARKSLLKIRNGNT